MTSDKCIQLFTAGLIVVKDNKLLLAFSKNKNAWYLPGGKVDAGETAAEALQREIKEELNITLHPQDLKYYYHITAPAYGEATNILMEQDCFLYEINEPITPGNEIADVRFFDLPAYLQEPVQVVGVMKAFERLTQDGLI